MADPKDNTRAEKSYLEMSDEELLAAPLPEVPATEEPAKPEATDNDGGDKTDTAVATTDDTDDQADDKAPEDASKASNNDAASDDDADAGTADAEEAAKPAKQEAKDDVKSDPKAKVDEAKPDDAKKDDEKPKIDFEAEYNRILAPFKANGREIQVKSIDDAITLMQMGANYNKKMAALKPNLKLLKMLENNGLLSEEKLSFLIDLDKKNPDAINKLIKDSGIDPMGIDLEKAANYRPTTQKVDDREVELDQVLDEIQNTPTYARTLSIVTKEWDEASKQTIANTPQLLNVINNHVASGIYDLISKEVDSERAVGRLRGLSDIEAYRQVGDAIHARGGFNHLVSQGKPAATDEVIQPKPKKVEDDKLKEKRRAAAGPAKPAAPSKAAISDFNPLALSDEEFEKIATARFA